MLSLRATATVFATAAVLCLSLGAPVSAQTPKRGGILTHAINGEPPNLDLQQSVSALALGLVRPVYSQLVRYDQNNYPNVIGDLAQSWTISPDGKTYTFKLEPNVKFHDGSPFTSADVKANFDRIRNPPAGVTSMRKADFDGLATVETPDPLTAVFRLSEPDAAFLVLLANPFNVLYSARKLAAEPTYPATIPMGTGAYTFGEYVRGSHATGKKFDGYFRQGLPYLDGYRVQIMTATAAVNSMAAGQVDAIFRSLLQPEMAILRSALGDRAVMETTVSGTHTFVTVNNKRKPYDDVRVRRALRLAIDYHGSVEAMSKLSNSYSVGGPMRPGYEMTLPPAELEKYPGFGRDVAANRAEAKRLLAEAGQSNIKVRLLNRNISAYIPLGVFALSQWQATGIAAEQESLEPATVISRVAAGDFDATIDTNVTPADDPTVVLSKFAPEAANNFAGFVDPMLTDLYQKQKITVDPTQRRQFVNAFERRVLEQAYYIPLYWNSTTPGYRSFLHGWKGTPTTVMGFDLVEVWKD